MRWFATATATAMLLGALTLSAGETAKKKGPLGEWFRTKDDTTVKFRITADTVYFTSEGPLGKLDLEADYGVSKNGKTMFGHIRTVKEGAGPAKGELFAFAFKVKGDKLTISDWKGSGGTGLAGAFVQGEYAKAEAKKE